MTARDHMLMFSVFALAGIVLCVRKHWIWGVVCFLIAVGTLCLMVEQNQTL